MSEPGWQKTLPFPPVVTRRCTPGIAQRSSGTVIAELLGSSQYGCGPRSYCCFTQMTILIESGTSVPLGLEALAEQMPTSYFKQSVGVSRTAAMYPGHSTRQRCAHA